jgi:uncharacterized protein (DUF608 family)
MTSKLFDRRGFLRLGAQCAGAVGAADVLAHESAANAGASIASTATAPRKYNDTYRDEHLSRVAFPMGGIGAGMICLEGTGALASFSLHHHPDVFNQPNVFAALSIKGKRPIARVLEGPVPTWKLFGAPNAASGGIGHCWGLPRCTRASFKSSFPFGQVSLEDKDLPFSAQVTGWSPFEPGDADNASLPVIGLEYRFVNDSTEAVDAVFSFNSANFMIVRAGDFSEWINGAEASRNMIGAVPGGFLLQGSPTEKEPWQAGSCAIWTDDSSVKVNHAWFRARDWSPDSITMAWRDVANAACYDRPAITEGVPAPGASLFVPFRLAPKESKTIAVRLAWYVGDSNLRMPGMIVRDGKLAFLSEGHAEGLQTFQPWYAGRFANVEEVMAYWQKNYVDLKQRAQRFSDCLHGSTLPPEVIEAVASNLSILKSPTVLRQTDGRFWAWEGSDDAAGSCDGSCTHVWNYAQAIPHLFPELERTLRETEFGPSQSDDGHQAFRSALPIRPRDHGFYAAADGQLGGVIKVHREWRISGDTVWMKSLWPKVRKSLDYCIRTWDPRHRGWIEEPHHNTYDIEFWGADGMHASIYLSALKAAISMGRQLEDDVGLYESLLRKGIRNTETELFDGEFFIQKVDWQSLQAKFSGDGGLVSGRYSPEALALAEKEGPKYQYGHGCLADGVLGQWFAEVCGVGQVLDPAKVKSHLRSVYQYNLKQNLSRHVNAQRPTFACGAEGGLLLCTWPKGAKPSLPFIYSDEVWTGIEYQVASHLIMTGMVDEGLEVVRTCRARYDGRIRNPFDEYEAGHWYARALSSYALLQALSGARYDAVDKALYLNPAIKGDFRCFISTAAGYGTVGVRDGKPFLEVVSGTIDYAEIKYTPRV